MNNQVLQVFQISLDELKSIIQDAVDKSLQPLNIQKSEVRLINNSKIENDLLSREEVKDILKLSYPTLWKYNKNGTLKIKKKIGRRVYYSRKDLNQLIRDSS